MKSFPSIISLFVFLTLFKYNIQAIACDDNCKDCAFYLKCNSCKDHYFLKKMVV